MKIKRFAVERIEVDVEYVRPILGRLYLLSKFYKLVKFTKIQPFIFGEPVCKPFYRIYIPKLNTVK